MNVLIVLGCAGYLWGLHGALDLIPVFVIAFLHASYLAIFSTRGAVEESARTYARQLLMCTEAPSLNKISVGNVMAEGKFRKRKPEEPELLPGDGSGPA